MVERIDMVRRWPRRRALELRSVLDGIQLCACGTDAHWACVLELLKEGEKHKEKNGFYRDAWFEFGAKVLDAWHLLEHGGSIGWASLTTNGALVLEFLRDFGTDDGEHPEWAQEFSWGEAENETDAYAAWVEQERTLHPDGREVETQA